MAALSGVPEVAVQTSGGEAAMSWDEEYDDGGAWHHADECQRRRQEDELEKLMAEAREHAAEAAADWAEYEKWSADWWKRIRSKAA